MKTNNIINHSKEDRMKNPYTAIEIARMYRAAWPIKDGIWKKDAEKMRAYESACDVFLTYASDPELAWAEVEHELLRARELDAIEQYGPHLAGNKGRKGG